MRENARKLLSGWEHFWYVVMNIFPPFGAYFHKIPAKKAATEFGMGKLTTAENFWYVVMNIFPPAGGYFYKVIYKTALAQALEDTAAKDETAHA